MALELLPGLGKNPARALLIKPADLFRANQEDAAQHQLRHSLGVRLRIRQAERAAPRATEHLPALDAEVRAQLLDVAHQMPGGVFLQARERRAAAAAALIEQHDAIARGIKEAPLLGLRAAARSAVQEHDRLALGVAALLEVELVQRRDGQPPTTIGFDLRVQGLPLGTHALSSSSG
jgi:hypothetical protein